VSISASPARGGIGRRGAVLLACLVLMAGACHRAPGSASGAPASPADPFGRVAVGPHDTLQLGILLGLSGSDPDVGLSALHGVELAIDYLDGTFDGKQGTLMEHPINLEIEDDRCTADGARSGAEELSSDARVVGVIGLSCPSAAIGGADRILSGHGVLLISPADTDPGLTADGTHQPFFLRTAYNQALDGVVMADFARGTGGAQTAGVIGDPGDVSTALAEQFTRTFETKGGTVVSTNAVDTSGAGLFQAFQDLEKQPPDFLFVPGSDPACPAVIHAAQDVGSLGAMAAGSSAACQGTFRPALDGAKTGPFLSMTDPADIQGGEFYSLQFLPAYQDEPDPGNMPVVAAFAFDAANILFDAMQVSAQRANDGSLVFGRTTLRDAIFATDSYEGLTGPLTCTSLGDCAAPARFDVYPAADLPAQGEDPTTKPVFTEVVSSTDLVP
jgi:branched-chain amino acid transport system substrate-binding protein